jgi:PX domain
MQYKANIRSTQVSLDNIVEYVIHVHVKGILRPAVNKRFSDFDKLLFDLEWAGFSLLPMLPNKTLINHIDGPVIQQRITGLNRVLKLLMKRQDIRYHHFLLEFLNIEFLDKKEIAYAASLVDIGILDGSRLPMLGFACSQELRSVIYTIHGDTSPLARMGKLWAIVEKEPQGSLSAWVPHEGNTWKEIEYVTFTYKALCVKGNSSFVCIGTDVGTLVIYSVVDLKTPKFTLEVHGNMSICDIDLIGNNVVSIGLDGSLRVVDAGTGILLCGGRLNKRLKTGEILLRVKTVVNFAYIATNQNQIFLFDVSKHPHPDFVDVFPLPETAEIEDIAVDENFLYAALKTEICRIDLKSKERELMVAFAGLTARRIFVSEKVLVFGSKGPLECFLSLEI